MFEDIFGIHDQAMMLRARRAAVVAENLANADTPGFKARDIDFRSVLNNMLDERAGLRATHALHIQPDGNSVPSAELLFRQPYQPSLDGNTVDTQMEQSAFTSNAIAYQASLRFLNGRISGYIKALRGE